MTTSTISSSATIHLCCRQLCWRLNMHAFCFWDVKYACIFKIPSNIAASKCMHLHARACISMLVHAFARADHGLL